MVNLVTADTILNRKFITAGKFEYLLTQCDYREDSVYVWKNSDMTNTHNRGCWRKVSVVDNINHGVWTLMN